MPLYMAACRGHVAAVLAFLAAGADVSLLCRGKLKALVICGAAETGNVEALKLLIEHGADTEATAVNKHTALHQGELGAHAHRVWGKHRSTKCLWVHSSSSCLRNEQPRSPAAF